MKHLLLIVWMVVALAARVGPAMSADYQNGWDAYLKKDYGAALAEFTALAEMGNAPAQALLALMYDQGDGVLQNYRTALKFYTLAAEQGHAGAQLNLAMMYVGGKGTRQDYTRAHMWLTLAATKGIALAKHNRDVAEQRMSSADISTAQRLARACVQKNFKGCYDLSI